ncbi:MAG: hypothetical protein QOE70_6356 [Chthoniobacter sp.]|jgi:ABC-type Fe3+ transport system permease subunit|nr:hypothetical protein [Chthoniobacter sp.]
MKNPNALATLAGILGTLTFALGLVIAGSSLCIPSGGPKSSGLYRWTPLDGQQLLVYSSGPSATWTSVRVVLTAAATFVIVGSSLIFVGRRLRARN